MCSDHCLWKGNLHVLIGSNGRDKTMANGTKNDSSVSDFSVLFLISQLQDLLAHCATVTEASTTYYLVTSPAGCLRRKRASKHVCNSG